MLYKKSILLSSLLFIVSGIVWAQGEEPAFGREATEKSFIRKILNRFTWSISGGYGFTFYSHQLNDFSLIETEDRIYIYDLQDSSRAYIDWLNDPSSQPKPANGNRFNPDSTTLAYKSTAHSLPLTLSLHFNIYMVRIGGGLSFEWHTLRPMQPVDSKIPDYQPVIAKTRFTRFFGLVGARVYELRDFSFVVDAQFGVLNNMGKAFNEELIDKGAYINLGISIERNFSEYFRAFFRPSYEFKNYTVKLPDSQLTILHKQPALFLQAGISYNFPDIPRCRIKGCRTQLSHMHGGKEYRGHSIFKKQNPGYGEKQRKAKSPARGK